MTIVADEKRLLRGDRLKNVDGRWSGPGDAPVPEKMLAIGSIRAVQRWQNQKIADCIVETAAERLPHVADLNAEVPKSEWEPGLDGKPKPPWQNVWGFYLVNPDDGSIYTFINGTIGARICYEKLHDRIQMMRTFRGTQVAPIVKLDSRPMKTQFGTKLRPEFTVVGWVGLNGNTSPAIEHKPTTATLEPVAELSASEVLSDEIPF
jgi:hypothetical protein